MQILQKEIHTTITIFKNYAEECDLKALYRKCQQCLQAVNIEQLNVHHTSIQCTCKWTKSLDWAQKQILKSTLIYGYFPVMTMKKTCPLCFTEIKDGEEQLRIHLARTGAGICPKHPRSKYLLVSTQHLNPFDATSVRLYRFSLTFVAGTQRRIIKILKH